MSTRRHTQFIPVLLRAGDVVTALAAWILAYAGVHLAARLEWVGPVKTSPAEVLAPAVLSLILTPLIFARFGLYEPKRTQSVLREAGDLARGVFAVWAVVYIVTSLMRHAAIPRPLLPLVLVEWLVLAVAGRSAARVLLRGLRSRGWNQRRAAIVGIGRLGQKLYHALKRTSWTGIETVYFVGDPDRRTELLGLRVHGPVEDTGKIVAEKPVDIVFVALPGGQHDLVEGILEDLAAAAVDVRVVPDLPFFSFLSPEVGQLADLPVISMRHSPMQGPRAFLKRAFDVVVSALALLVLGGPMLLIALLVKLTNGGPVLYRQKRATLEGRAFRVFKFRTMIRDAEKHCGAVWAVRDDPRVTPVGRVLRRTSLDELPQLINVLLGDMSLVGPRPERPELIERFREQVPRYMLRHKVKAGLTGWAQVNGLRGRTSLRRRLQYDLYYIRNWSFLLDLRILLLTLTRGLVHPNAY